MSWAPNSLHKKSWSRWRDLMALIAKKNEEEEEAAPSGARERCEEFAKKIVAKDAAIAYDKEILNRGFSGISETVTTI